MSSLPNESTQHSPRRSKPRLSLDTDILSKQFEEHKRQFDEMVEEVQDKINLVKDQRASKHSSPRRSTANARETHAGDEKERESYSSPMATTVAMAPLPAPIGAPIPTTAPMSAPAPLPGPSPILTWFAPMPFTPAPIPTGVQLNQLPSAPVHRPSGLYLKQYSRLKRHRARYYRCLTLCHGFIRHFCLAPNNYAVRVICDMVTVYNGLDFYSLRPRPEVPMKALFWKKVKAHRVERSNFWSCIVEESRFIDTRRLEDKFKKIEIVRKERSAAEKKEEEKPQMFIGHRKMVVMTVMMKISRLSVDDILRCIRELDDEKVNVRELYSLAPTDEEINRARQDMIEIGDESLLTDVQRFWWGLCNIPKLKIRLELWLFKLDFETEVELRQEDLATVEKAAHCILESDRLKVFFSAVLAVGNYLNHGARRGNAQGVSLDVLAQMQGLRENGSRQTLLTYIYEIIEEREPDALNLHEDLAAIYPMDGFDWSNLDACRVMARAVTDMQAMFLSEFGEATDARMYQDEKERDMEDVATVDETDRFFPVLSRFFDDYIDRCRRMGRRCNKLLRDITALKKEFWEDRTEDADFFWKWLMFVEAWQATAGQVAHRRRMEELQAHREEIKRIRREEAKRRREAMLARGDGEAWTYRQKFKLNKAQYQHCHSGFFLSYLQKNFAGYGTLEFDAEEQTLFVTVEDGELQPEAMEILKTYLGKLVPCED